MKYQFSAIIIILMLTYSAPQNFVPLVLTKIKTKSKVIHSKSTSSTRSHLSIAKIYLQFTKLVLRIRSCQ